MFESSPESRLNAYQFSLRQLLLWMHIVAVACSAFAGIGQILVGSDDFRVLFTAVTIALASVCALEGAPESRW
jgi:magnesium-transporting ATPase (P-type)